jgi:hypothetical protein
MIVLEWKRILEGKEPFVDKEVETVANAILEKIKEAAANDDKATLIELYNDLEQLMGKGEWLARKVQRLNEMLSTEPLTAEDKQALQDKSVKVKELRDKVVNELKTKYVSLKAL